MQIRRRVVCKLLGCTSRYRKCINNGRPVLLLCVVTDPDCLSVELSTWSLLFRSANPVSIKTGFLSSSGK